MIGTFLGDFFAYYTDMGEAEQLRKAVAGEEVPDFPEYEVSACIRMNAAVMQIMKFYKEGRLEKDQITMSVTTSLFLWMDYGEAPAEEELGQIFNGLASYQIEMGNAPLAAASLVSAIGWLFDTLDEVLEMTELAAANLGEHPGETIAAAQAVTAAIFWMRQQREKEEARDDCLKILDMAGPELSQEGEEAFRLIRQILDIFVEEDSWEDIVKRAYVEGGRTAARIAGAIADSDYDEDLGLIAEARLHIGPELLRLLDYLEEARDLYFGNTPLGDAICELVFGDAEPDRAQLRREVREVVFRKLTASCDVYYPTIVDPSFPRESSVFQGEEDGDGLPVWDKDFCVENGIPLTLLALDTEGSPSVPAFIQKPGKSQIPVEGVGLLKFPLRDGIELMLEDPSAEKLILNPGELNFMIRKEEAESYLKYAARIRELEDIEAEWKNIIADVISE